MNIGALLLGIFIAAVLYAFIRRRETEQKDPEQKDPEQNDPENEAGVDLTPRIEATQLTQLKGIYRGGDKASVTPKRVSIALPTELNPSKIRDSKEIKQKTSPTSTEETDGILAGLWKWMGFAS
tara:strand:- start:5800 stop:6171 length:372 start_codon:yes stop_codon:yes gene_type:complete